MTDRDLGNPVEETGNTDFSGRLQDNLVEAEQAQKADMAAERQVIATVIPLAAQSRYFPANDKGAPIKKEQALSHFFGASHAAGRGLGYVARKPAQTLSITPQGHSDSRFIEVFANPGQKKKPKFEGIFPRAQIAQQSLEGMIGLPVKDSTTLRAIRAQRYLALSRALTIKQHLDRGALSEMPWDAKTMTREMDVLFGQGVDLIENFVQGRKKDPGAAR